MPFLLSFIMMLSCFSHMYTQSQKISTNNKALPKVVTKSKSTKDTKISASKVDQAKLKDEKADEKIELAKLKDEKADKKTNLTKLKDKKNINLAKLKNQHVWSHPTFAPYNSNKYISSDIAVWKDRYQIPQETYKVSLVGMNINTWLENPEYFNIFETEALKFSAYDLLDNLQSYNPKLIFNDPKVVANAIHKDIYTPYLQNVTNYSSKNISFSDINRVISYTRRFHIYGVSSGGLPYFGRPMEGGQRQINLGILSGQISEIATKLPETDIFLVAMINVIPNWLEEGVNIFQVSQQELEINIYAFNRNGKLIGGAGIPMDFIHKGSYYVMEQKIRSKIWQPGTSRTFYITPSFNMMNDKDKNASSIPEIKLPEDIWPKLDGYQKYILSAINYLRADKKDINVELFNQNGDKALAVKTMKKQKSAELANRILLHKDSHLLVDTELEFPNLQQGSLFVRLNNKNKEISNKDAAAIKNILSKKNYPSNEGRKLVSLLTYGREVITNKPFTLSNQLYYTNEILPYELEMDPIIYAYKQKEYAILQHSLKKMKKDFNKITKDMVQKEKLIFKEKIFWEQFKIDRLKILGLLTDDISIAFQEWLTTIKKLTDISLKKININRQISLINEQEQKFPELKNRNQMFLSEKYKDKKDKLQIALTKLNTTSEQMLVVLKKQNQQLIKHQQEINEQLSQFKKEEETVYNNLTKLYPLKVNYTNFSEKEKKIDLNIDKELLKYNQFVLDRGRDISLVKMAIGLKKYSPLFKDTRKKEQKKIEKYFYYEGFILGLTRAWTVKTKLEDRMSYL